MFDSRGRYRCGWTHRRKEEEKNPDVVCQHRLWRTNFLTHRDVTTRFNELTRFSDKPLLFRTGSNMAAVDVEDESILASIFKDSFPDSRRDNPDFAAYLSELSSFGLDKLVREPERLAEERAQILQQTRELAFSNYQTFIRTADCTEHIYRDFGRVEGSVSRLLDKLPGFGERCRWVLLVNRFNKATVKLFNCKH